MISFNNMKTLCFLIICGALFTLSAAIDCYQCSGSDPERPFQCNEWLTDDVDLKPESCDSVYDAKYCIKHIGRFEASAILCYQCTAADSIDCSDGMIRMGGIEPQSCDNVFEAQYCVKSTSLHRGIGAKRFCSSLDLGNYCNYVSQPGDLLNYRTCIYTCKGDGCNPATRPQSQFFIILGAIALTTYQILKS
ncbi:U-scoloptoxin(05)-Sm1a [Harmonia axyridis]|uniref:U-scoloptoxin(05)-Sm1a n=1 Tax=Harmonia axyridis TaxID=115357 RepID=UPI001E277CD6|nr:U-scoloptoxin(05)-Sm1a [Harmonia axyridis]